MPFEPAPKESPAARLAALIEAGRAANPNVKRDVHKFTERGSAGVLDRGCALCMALLGKGVGQRTIYYGNGYDLVAKYLSEFDPVLLEAVERVNFEVKSFDAICLSLREGELAKVTA